MKCLIYSSSKEDKWLRECFDKVNPYLLRIVNKPLLEYFVDFCSTLQISDIRIVSNLSTEDFHSHFEDGKKWGVNISYNIAKPEDNLQRVVLKNYSFCKEDDTLIFSGLFFLEYDINQVGRESQNIIDSLRNTHNKYCQVLTKGISFKEVDEKSDFFENPYLKITKLSSVMDYFQLSQNILTNQDKNYVLPGYSSEPQTFLGMNVIYPKSTSISNKVMIGNNVRIGEMVEIKENSVIGDNVIIESLTSVSNSIIYNDSFVGSDLEINNKIIYRNKLISGSTGQVVVMDDDFLISDLQKEKKMGILQKSLHFFLALIQIIIQTIPFLIILPCLLILHKKYNLTQVYYTSKDLQVRKMFSVDNVRKHPFIRFINKFSLDKYPNLFYVLSGKLLLVGNKMFTMNKRHKRILSHLPYYRAGLYSYWESLHQGFSSEEEIHELYYLNNSNFFKNLYIYAKITVMRLFW